MIDKKKIDKASKEYAKEKEKICKELAEKYKSATSIGNWVTVCPDAAFKDGINWLLKNFWHPASEEPKHDKQITYVWGNGIAKTIILNEEADKFNRTPSQIWHNICKNYKVVSWLYIDDLLPK